MTIDEQILVWDAEGVPQKEMCRRLGLGRGAVQHLRRKMGLTAKIPGPVAPELTEAQRQEALELLGTGIGYVRVAEQLNLREHAVRQLQEQHCPREFGHRGYRVKWSPTKKKKILETIERRAAPAKELAHKFNLPYSTTKKIAHSVFGPAPFVGGGGAIVSPFTSRFPQKPPKGK